MDLDQAKSSGIRNHDQLTDNPTSAGLRKGCGGDSWTCTLLRRGWDLSRKAAISGAAATAAPIVAPPLIVLSAAGIMLSVPFAAYLVSLVATNHLMGALLPSSPAHPYHTWDQEDDVVVEEFLDASDEYGQEAPAFGSWNKTKEGTIEENESGTSLLLSRDAGVSEAPVPAFADQVDDEVEGEFSVQESGHESLASNSGDKESESTRKEAVPWGFYVSESAKSLLQYEDNANVVQRKGEDDVVLQESGQESFESKNWKKKEEGTTMEENKSTKETLSQGIYFSESPVPLPGDDDNVVQGDGEGEFSVQNLGQDLLLPNSGDKKEERIAMEENKSTKDMPPRDFVVSESSVPVFRGEDNVVQSNGEVEVAAQGVIEEVNSYTNLVTGEVVDVQVEIVTAAVPESAVPPQSNLAACESPADLVEGEVVDVQVDIVAAVAPESEALPPSNLAACGSLADVVTGEIVDVPVDTVAAVAPESEVLPLSNLAACESPAVVETAYDGDIVGITVMEGIMRDSGDVNKEGVERRFVSVASVICMHDVEDVMSSGSTPYVSASGDEMIDQANQEAGVEYTVMNERFGRKVVAGDEIQYTEEQLREQVDTISTITGYRAVPCSTLEDELAGLYILVGVEAPVGSTDTSDRLMELNAKLRFLKSIIGVE